MYNLVNIQDAKLRTVILDIQNIKTKKKISHKYYQKKVVSAPIKMKV